MPKECEGWERRPPCILALVTRPPRMNNTQVKSSAFQSE